MKAKNFLFTLCLIFVFSFILYNPSIARIRFSSVDSCFGLTGKSILRHCIGAKFIGWKDASLLGLKDAYYDYQDVSLGGSDPKRIGAFDVLDQDFIYDAEAAINCMNTTGDFYFTRLQGIQSPISFAIGGINQMSLINTDSHYYEVDKNCFAIAAVAVFPWHDKGEAPLATIARGKDGSLCGVVGTTQGGFSAGRIYRYDFDTQTWSELAPTGVTSFSGFDHVAMTDWFNIWATAIDGSGSKPYKWIEEESRWEDCSAGNSPNGRGRILDIGADHIAWGIRGSDVVRWDNATKQWYTVTVAFPSYFNDFYAYHLIEIAATFSDNVVVCVDLQTLQAGGSIAHFYRLFKLRDINDTIPYQANVTTAKDNAISPEIGYYGDIWYRDPRTGFCYRLIGGNLRTTANFIDELPDTIFFDFALGLLGDEYTMNGLVCTRGIDLDSETILTTGPNSNFNCPISLNGGTLALDGDLYLSSTTRLCTGGKIDGRGHAIILGGNLEIPESQSLRFTSTTIIDGKGHSLILSSSAQLIVDNNVTLSLRNLVLKDLQNLLMPGIVMIASGSELSLQNVELALSSDYSFTQGYLLIDNDVMITGTSQFIYESSQPCYINKFATLYFDLGTTFSYVPANSSRTLIDMKDVTSVLFLNGCSLCAPGDSRYNGIVLTRGRLILDNYLSFKNLNGTTPNSDRSKAITFGDGSSAGNDIDVKVLAGAFVEVEGYLDYDPV
ncbi:MAG: hypothetical protein FK734_04985 [Asgard group archaeon]|nr:hypothetical protein [Asgard group archaeon]